ncbi:hypothetical protein CLIB1423_02S03400 [[Candida] railenensis]|uniref:Carbohydrate kinase PfkB domain-containing protein n=1 Tax=[Candida] railenensis TaxID=45579 RepID=A0A9P0QLE9_9ASCO|nr:hypothetical protein CLIB1423_02S03400 [[Candida] railenensis]
MPNEQPCMFTSMGMFIIDENRYEESFSKEPETNIIGGGLTYAVAGARMIAGPQKGSSVAGIVDKGSDFPPEIESTLKSWNSGLIFRSDPSRLTSRGVNYYKGNGIRDFFYETPKKRIEVIDILSYDRLLNSDSFHLICSIERCSEIIDTILANRGNNSAIPQFIWEPVPYDCIPENYDALCKLLAKVDIFTPNLIEAQNFIETTDKELPTAELKQFVDDHFMKYLTKPSSGALIRCGARGCYIRTPKLSSVIPAYHDDQTLVIDPTGGGNSFCGGFMVGYLLSNKDWKVGAICGNLVSGCIIEKLGPPEVKLENNIEYWNDKSMGERLYEYRRKYPSIDMATLDFL